MHKTSASEGRCALAALASGCTGCTGLATAAAGFGHGHHATSASVEDQAVGLQAHARVFIASEWFQLLYCFLD